MATGKSAVSTITFASSMEAASNMPFSMPAIALTGLSRFGEQERAIAAGFQRYVVKPVSPAALIEVILSLVENKAAAPA